MFILQKIENEFSSFKHEEKQLEEDTIQRWRDDPNMSDDENEWLRFAYDAASDDASELFEKKVMELVATLTAEERNDILNCFADRIKDELEDAICERKASEAVLLRVVLDKLHFPNEK